MGGDSGCETTASTGLSPLLTSLLSHCSHGGNSFTAETFVNDDRESGRRLRRWPEAIIDKGLSGETRSAMRNDGSHSTVSVSLVSRRRGPRLLPENRPGRMLLKLLSPILHLLARCRALLPHDLSRPRKLSPILQFVETLIVACALSQPLLLIVRNVTIGRAEQLAQNFVGLVLFGANADAAS
jgi:hypothetical protein